MAQQVRISICADHCLLVPKTFNECQFIELNGKLWNILGSSLKATERNMHTDDIGCKCNQKWDLKTLFTYEKEVEETSTSFQSVPYPSYWRRKG